MATIKHVYNDKSFVSDSSGNIGIGTITPSQKLDVQGTILVNNEIQFVDANMRIFRSSNDMRFRTGGSDKVTIESGGNVGIGTTDPAELLEVMKDGGAIIRLHDPGNNSWKLKADTEFHIYDDSNVDYFKIANSGDVTVSKDLILGTTSRIVLKDQPAASTVSGSGIIVKWTVNSATTVGQVYSIKGDGGWADVASSGFQATLMLGYSLGTNSTQGILLQGFLYKSSHGFTIGAPIYIGGSQGALTNTAPTTTGHFVRIIGYATSTDYIYFDPDKTWIELV